MFSKTAALVVLAAAAGSQAQSLSSSCTGAVAQLAFSDLGRCLSLTSALSLLGTSGSIIDPLNSYLNDFCAESTPTCSNSTLESAQTTIEQSCASDLNAAGGSSAANILETLLNNYPQVKTAACSRNETADQFCVVNTLSTVQNTTGTSVDLSFFTGLIGASDAPDALTQLAQTGQLCTGCNQEIWTQAKIADPNFANSSFGQSVTDQCGANFTSATPTGVTNPSSAATSNAATSSAAAPSSAAGMTKNTDVVPYLFTAGTLLAGLAIGGAALF